MKYRYYSRICVHTSLCSRCCAYCCFCVVFLSFLAKRRQRNTILWRVIFRELVPRNKYWYANNNTVERFERECGTPPPSADGALAGFFRLARKREYASRKGIAHPALQVNTIFNIQRQIGSAGRWMTVTQHPENRCMGRLFSNGIHFRQRSSCFIIDGFAGHSDCSNAAVVGTDPDDCAFVSLLLTRVGR